MLFFIIILDIFIYFVNFVELLENSLSLSVENKVDYFRLFSNGNISIFDEELIQQFVIFNSKKEQKIVAHFGNFNTVKKVTSKLSNMSVQLNLDRYAFLIPTESNSIIINTLCEFFYKKSQMSFLDENICCYTELHLNDEKLPNPIAFCQMKLGTPPSFCFTPLTISNILNFPSVALMTTTVHRLKSGRCTHPSPNSIYAISSPVSISFTNRPPSIWHLSHSSNSELLIGLPLHSSRPGENILIPLRVLSTSANVGNQFIALQCIFDERINVLSIIPNNFISILNNFSFSNSTHIFHNIKLQIPPGKDRELFSFNATLSSDSAKYTETITATMQCCFKKTLNIKVKKFECGDAQIMSLPVEINSMIIIPALKTSGNIFNIYDTPNVSLTKSSVKVYGVLNYRDRTVSEVSQKVKISVLNKNRITITDKITKESKVDLAYQTDLNPWSLQLSIYDCRYSILSPINLYRADSWRMILSENVLKPIKNWNVPGSTSNGRICVSRFKVARLKILCRLYKLDESGIRQYVGSEQYINPRPFLDVTDFTFLSQLRISPPNIISIEKSPDNNYFLVSANQISQSALIEVLSPESLQVIASTHISVEPDLESLYVVDLIIHCVNALHFYQRNESVDSIKMPHNYESVTVSMSTDSQSLPCYLLVFLVFSDKSIERVSSFDNSHYQMFLVTFDSQPLSRTNIIDGQLVTVKWTKHANISMFESTSCNKPNLIFSKQINWGEINPLKGQFPATNDPILKNAWVTPNQTNALVYGNDNDSSINLLHMSLYIFTAILAFCFLCLILHKIFCSKPHSLNQSTAPTCYNISDSGFMNDQNKIAIRNSNSKTFSSLGKCSTNCMRANNKKCHSNEPYPPLLPPPGPISANYDLTLNDRICCDSAVDSGIELGKLSSYSSTTNPSNDICCSIELHMSSSTNDDPSMRQPSQFSNQLFGFYTHKDIMESIHSYNDPMANKTISNLRPPLW